MGDSDFLLRRFCGLFLPIRRLPHDLTISLDGLSVPNLRRRNQGDHCETANEEASRDGYLSAQQSILRQPVDMQAHFI
jgi:hypothetical protein